MEEGALSLMRFAIRGGTGNDAKCGFSCACNCRPLGTPNRNTKSAGDGKRGKAGIQDLVELRVSGGSFSIVHRGGVGGWVQSLGYYCAFGTVSFEFLSLVFFLSLMGGVSGWYHELSR